MLIYPFVSLPLNFLDLSFMCSCCPVAFRVLLRVPSVVTYIPGDSRSWLRERDSLTAVVLLLHHYQIGSMSAQPLGQAIGMRCKGIQSKSDDGCFTWAATPFYKQVREDRGRKERSPDCQGWRTTLPIPLDDKLVGRCTTAALLLSVHQNECK